MPETAVESGGRETPSAVPEEFGAADGSSGGAAEGSSAEVVYEADPVLLAAVDQARAALGEIAPAETVGEVVGHLVEGEHVLSLFFASKLAGYPDWHWTATLSRVGDTGEPSVLEVEMLPGANSVLSPAWVPWADRLTPDALLDDSESEFDDDDVDDETPDDDDLDDSDDLDDDDGGDSDGLDDDSDDDDDDDDGEFDDEEVAALALRRDRDGIDIDTIADEGFEPRDAESPNSSEPSSERGAELSEAFAVAGGAASGAGFVFGSATDTSVVAPGEAVIDPDAGTAFDATDDFADAGDIEGRGGDEAGDRTY